MDRIPQTLSILDKPSSSNIIKTLQFSIIILSLLGSPIIYGQELPKKIVCTWDPVGTNGPVVSFFSDLIPIAISWGLNLSFVPYEEETRAIEDLTNGKCDIAIVTAILSRDLVPFAGTLDAIGGITSNTKLKEAIAALSSPKAKPLMSHGDYEVVASLPVGSMFAFVNDRKIRGIEGFKGKKWPFSIMTSKLKPLPNWPEPIQYKHH